LGGPTLRLGLALAGPVGRGPAPATRAHHAWMAIAVRTLRSSGHAREPSHGCGGDRPTDVVPFHPSDSPTALCPRYTPLPPRWVVDLVTGVWDTPCLACPRKRTPVSLARPWPRQLKRVTFWPLLSHVLCVCLRCRYRTEPPILIQSPRSRDLLLSPLYAESPPFFPFLFGKLSSAMNSSCPGIA
jgi:hypothetical protein